jgi:hypothetical protein
LLLPVERKTIEPMAARLDPGNVRRRRMKAKLGPAATATAHKMAIIFYAVVNKQVEYDASLWAYRDQKREKRHEATLQKQA